MIYPQLFEYALIVGLCPKTDDPGYEPYIIHKFPQTVSEFFYVQFFCNDFKFHALWFVNGVFFSILKVLAKLTFFFWLMVNMGYRHLVLFSGEKITVGLCV